MRKKSLIVFVGLMAILNGKEPSVYGAGDIDSPSPYGLTKTEKSVLENRTNIQNLKNIISEQQNRIDGLTTIIDGLNKEILSLKDQIVRLDKVQQTNLESNNNDYNKTYSLLLQVGNVVDEINNNYVTKEELKEALARSRTINQDRTLLRPQYNQDNSANISSIYREAVQLFSQRNYDLAKEKFKLAISKNYKPASSNYYLGEIAYYTKNYNDAVIYYKKSASLYDNASYMKVLYLHTAISLSKIGEQEQARNFFQFILDNYPNTKVAEIAQKNL